jgi:hypothetical protein
MHSIRKLSLLTAVRALQTTEVILDGLIQTRPYLPFAVCSLLVGFSIGFLLSRF